MSALLSKEILKQISHDTDEKIREVFSRLPLLRAEAIAEKIVWLLAQKEWRAVAEGIKLRARIAGDFAPTEVSMTGTRAEDLGNMDAVLAQIPRETLLALVQAARGQQHGGMND